MSKAADLARTASASETALGNRNVVINGAMQVAQRATSVASITADGYYTLDRWKSRIITMGTWTQSQSTDVPTGAGFATSLKMDCTTADASPAAGDNVRFFYGIEGQDLQQLKYGTADAEQLTLSFWVKATKTGVNVVTLFQDDGTKSISGTYTIETTNTWEYKTLTFVGNTADVIANDNTRGLLCIWQLGAGSDRTSGTLRTTWTAYAVADEAVGQVNNADSTSNDWYITGVQLEVGTVATPFEHRSYGQELALCQRYFQKLFNNVTSEHVSSGFSASTTKSITTLVFNRMRAIPTVATTTPTLFTTIDGITHDSSATAFLNIGGNSVRIDSTTTGLTAKSGALVRTLASCDGITFDAEL